MRVSLLAALTAFTLTLGCPNNAPGYCGDGLCRPAESESSITCASDCMSASCGDGTCAPGNGESCANCPGDCGGCGPQCGDGLCASSESCSLCPGDCGACGRSCDTSTCASGCCSGDSCLAGNSPSACGVGGLACLVCDATHFGCNAGACVPAPTSRWTLVIDSLRIDPTDYAGSGWDGGLSGPDPYVLVRIGSTTAPPVRVTGATDQLATRFTSASARITDRRADALTTLVQFAVLEDDAPGTDDGVCTLTYSRSDPSWFSGALQEATCTASAAMRISGTTVTWHLEPF